MANWNYTHGSTSNRDRLRFILGDHRGANGGFTGTNQLWSDEELDDCLVMATNNLPTAAAIASINRICREAMVSGVSGTTDTTGRPKNIAGAIEELRKISSDVWTGLPADTTRDPGDIPGGDDLAQERE